MGPRELAITFDDAYRGLRDHAFPVLEAHGFGAICFVAAVWREVLPEITPAHDVRRLPRPVLIVVNGFLVLVSLAALVGLLAS